MKSIVLKFLALFVFLTATSAFANASAAAHGEASASTHKEETYKSQDFSAMVGGFLKSTGVYALANPDPDELNSNGEKMNDFHKSWGRVLMILLTFFLFWLAIKKGFEPLLLLPIAFGGLLANIPVAGIAGDHGFLGVIYGMGLSNEMFPIIIFMGVGAMTDFGPLLSNPKTALLGGAAQFGIFGTLVGAVALSQMGFVDFTLQQASAISIIPRLIPCNSSPAPESLSKRKKSTISDTLISF